LSKALEIRLVTVDDTFMRGLWICVPQTFFFCVLVFFYRGFFVLWKLVSCTLRSSCASFFLKLLLSLF
jgi:hypothetical protein